MDIEHLSDRPNDRRNKTNRTENTNGTDATQRFDYGMSHRSNGPVLNHSPFGAMTGDQGPKTTRYETNSGKEPYDERMLSSDSERPSTSRQVETPQDFAWWENDKLPTGSSLLLDSEWPSTSTQVETPEQAEFKRKQRYDSEVEKYYPTIEEKLQGFCRDFVRRNTTASYLKALLF